MAKVRISVPESAAARLLFVADHTCCVCRERGKPVQLHHLDENPSNHDPDNLAVLCLICHDSTQNVGGFGRKLRAAEIREFRDDWQKRVRERRDKADEFAVLKQLQLTAPIATSQEEAEALFVPADQALVDYVAHLPDALAVAYAQAEPKWGGSTYDMMEGSSDVIAVVKQLWVHLATWFPPNHFGERPADEYFDDLVAHMGAWYRALLEPEGPGTGGTIVGPLTGSAVLSATERAVEETVHALLDRREGFSFRAWRERWHRAGRQSAE